MDRKWVVVPINMINVAYLSLTVPGLILTSDYFKQLPKQLKLEHEKFKCVPDGYAVCNKHTRL